jgi:hypothetical protein
MAIDVFISVGRTSTAEQVRFVGAIERMLVEHDLRPRRAQFSSVQPLKKVQETLAASHGTVVIAFERLFADQALELRGSDESEIIDNLKVTTVWNHIEAALAYGLGHPLLIVCEYDLRRDGMLIERDWSVYRTTVNESSLDNPVFHGVFSDWLDRVRSYHQETRPLAIAATESSNQRLEEKSIAEFLGAFTPAQLWIAGAATLALLSSVASVAFWLGGLVGSGG